MKLKKLFILVLAIILTIGMLGINLNVKAEGEETNVAKIGDTEYATMEEAFAAAQDGDTITVIADAHITTTVTIVANNKITLNLNGKTLTLDGAGKRKITNNGELTITGNGTMHNSNGAYGMVDNYGKLTIENGTFNDHSINGDGAMFRNQTGATINIYDGTFNVEEGPRSNSVVTNNNATLNFTGGTIDSHSGGKSGGCYALIIRGGNVNLSNITVYGAMGAVGIEYGDVIIDSGSYTAGAYYGIWVTNNGNTKVTVNGGKFVGNLYGLYASVDDGLQDNGDADITVTGGEFIGLQKDSAAIGTSRTTEHDWSLSISGGTFSSSVYKYLAENYTEYEKEGKYIVAPMATVEAKDKIYLKVGEEADLGIEVSNEAVEDLVEIELLDVEEIKDLEEMAEYKDSLNNNAITLDGETVTAVEPGVGVVSVTLGGMGTEVIVTVYDVKASNEDSENANKVTENIVEQLLEDTEELPVGIDQETADAVIEAVKAGETITTELTTETLAEPTKEDIELIDAKLEDAKIVGYYEVNVILKVNNEEIGKLTQLSKTVVVELTVPNNIEAVAEGYTRTYSVIRIHNGVAEVIAEGLTAEEGKIIAESDKFSTYALAYTDTKIPEPTLQEDTTGDQELGEGTETKQEENKTEETKPEEVKQEETKQEEAKAEETKTEEKKDSNPTTGDTIFTTVAVLMLSAVGIEITNKMRKKNK